MPAVCKLIRQQRAERAAEAVSGAEDPPAVAGRGQIVHQPQHLSVHAVIGVQEAAVHLPIKKGACWAAMQLQRMSSLLPAAGRACHPTAGQWGHMHDGA